MMTNRTLDSVMRWIMVGLVVGNLACAHRSSSPQPVDPLVAPTPMHAGGLVNYFDVISTVADSDNVKQRRDEAFHAVNAAGVRLASIDVGPRNLEVLVGADLDLMRALSVVGRDTAGRVVEGWSPYFLSSDVYLARTDELVLMAFAPGTVEVFVRPNVRRDTVRRIIPPPRPVTGSTFVVIKPRPYAPPAAPPTSARDVLDAYTAALGAEQWMDAARHVYQAGFARHVNTRIASFRPPPGPDMTLEQYLAGYQRLANPPPREVLVRQYEARQRARSNLPDQATLKDEFRDVTSIAQLAALPTLEAVARWLETTDPRTRARLDALGRCDPLATRRMVGRATIHLRPVGVVPVNDSLAWGVVMPLGFHTQPRIINRASQTLALRRSGSGAWTVDLQPEARGGSLSFGNECPRVERER